MKQGLFVLWAYYCPLVLVLQSQDSVLINNFVNLYSVMAYKLTWLITSNNDNGNDNNNNNKKKNNDDNNNNNNDNNNNTGVA